MEADRVPDEGNTEKGELTDETRLIMAGSSSLAECSSVRGLNSFHENGRSTLLPHEKNYYTSILDRGWSCRTKVRQNIYKV